jgi:hypothetical protein
MAGRHPWTMRNGGILSGLFPDADQDLAFRDLAPLGEPAWAQATRDLMARSAQGSAAARDYPIPGQPAPWFPSAPSAANPWPAPSQPTTDPYLNSRAQGPAWLGDSAGNPPPLLHELPYFASDPHLPQPLATPVARNSEAPGSNSRLSTEAPTPGNQSEDVMPVGYRIPMPWPGAVPWPTPPRMPDLEGWLEQTNKGLDGLFSYFRSRRRSSGGGGGDDECYRRWDAEDHRCYERDPIWWGDCKERAAERRNHCIRYGGPPSPYEPPEWGKDDEETSFYPNR